MLTSFFSLNSAAQTLQDGPHVLYLKDHVLIKSVHKNQLVETTLPIEKKAGLAIEVKFDEQPTWNFKVDIQSSLSNEAAETKNAEKLFVLSDIEGEFEGFRKLLIANHIIDEQYNWTFGKGHMVICGDLFDRGTEVTACLWLLYKLEQEAKAAGGYVHTILGNHDIMNLSGDLRYLQPKYIKTAAIMGVDYMTLYDENSELGRWLRTKNTIEKIGDFVFLHAGIAPQLIELNMSLTEINEKTRPFYDKVKKLDGLPGLIDPKYAVLFLGSSSLFWYRGYFSEPKASIAIVDAALKLYQCKAIVVGHTIVPGNVQFLYNGKVLALDVDRHNGNNQAVFYQNGQWYTVNDK